MEPAIVIVRWRDAFFSYDGSRDHEDYLVRTVGFLIEGPDGFVSVAAEELPEGDGHRAVTHIPIECFHSLVVLVPPR